MGKLVRDHALESPVGRVKSVTTLSRRALVVLLFFPFVYYPVSTVIWFADREFTGFYKEAIAGAAAALTVGALGLQVLVRRREIIRTWSVRDIVSAPESWAIGFLGWIAVISLFQREPSTLQNLIVYTVFVAAVCLAAFVGSTLDQVVRIFVIVFASILVVLGFAEAFFDPMRSEAGWQMGGPRLYASYGVIAVVGLFAIRLATWIRLVVGLALFAGAVISSSRSSMTTLLVVLAVGLTLTAPSAVRRLAWVAPMAFVSFIVALQQPWIRDHLAVSAITTPGAPIDDSGRGRVWILTVESWFTQPVVGHGAGSSQTVAGQSDFPLGHPHSEYLRILHDAGLIGFVLFGAFVVLALIWLWPRAGGKPRGELVTAGFLIVVAGLVLGTIENYLVFPSLMWPAAVFLGLGLAAARRDGQSPLDLRRNVRAASSEKTELPQT